MKAQHGCLLTYLAFFPVSSSAVESVEIEPQNPGHSITWLAEKLRPYQVEMSFDLATWLDFGLAQVRTDGPSALGLLYDPDPPVPGRMFFRVREGAIRPHFDSEGLSGHDDDDSELATIGFPIRFAGQLWTQLWVNNNGNVTFHEYEGMPDWTPLQLRTFDLCPIIAPFWADVDTRMPPPGHPDPWTVTYGPGTVDGHDAFGVNWVDVGYFEERVDKLNSFQLILINRSSGGMTGDFDIEFNYNQISWDEGDDSNSYEDGYGSGQSARAGLSDIDGIRMEIFGSGFNWMFLDTIVDATRTDTGVKNYVNGLIYRSHRNPVFFPGRFMFRFRNGIPLDDHLTVDAGSDPSAKNPLYSSFELTGSANTPQGSATYYTWTVVEYSGGGSAPVITTPHHLITWVTLPAPQTATFKLSAESLSGEMVIYAEDTVVLDRH